MKKIVRLNLYEIAQYLAAYDGSSLEETKKALQELRDQESITDDLSVGDNNGISLPIYVNQCPYMSEGGICNTPDTHAWKAGNFCGPYLGDQPQAQCGERKRLIEIGYGLGGERSVG